MTATRASQRRTEPLVRWATGQGDGARRASPRRAGREGRRNMSAQPDEHAAPDNAEVLCLESTGPQDGAGALVYPAAATLCDLLAAGPLNSRAVQLAMAARQFTPKQVRRARERLGVVVARAGQGRTMHSSWSLPAAAACCVGSVTGCAGGDVDPPVDHDEARALATSRQAPLMSDCEQRRHAARVTAFLGRGLDTQLASLVADALVLRDRDGLPAMGSCAECQNLEGQQCPSSPRPTTEVHVCWFRRQCTP